MVAKCGCGWFGVNLTPDYHMNVARCPSCNSIFQGIKAKNAIIVSDEREDEVIKEYNTLLLLANQTEDW